MTDTESDSRIYALTFSQYLNLIWRWAWLVVLAAVLAGGMAFIVSKLLPPVYQAKTSILVNELPTSENADYGSIQLNLQLSQTYAQMITKVPVLEEVARRLDLNKIDPEDVTAQSTTDLQLINITVDAPNPIEAEMIADTLVVVFREQAQSLRTARFDEIKTSLKSQITETEQLLHEANVQLAAANTEYDIQTFTTKVENVRQSYLSLLNNYEAVRLAEAESVSSLVQLEPATSTEEPISPQTFINVAIAILAGGILALVAIYLIGITDNTLKTPNEFMTVLNLPVLGSIGHYKSKGNPIVEVDPKSTIAEAFRALRTNVRFAGIRSTKPLQTLMVISPLAEDGKSTIAVNLGLVLAENGFRVCIIDANLRRPVIHRLLGVKNDVGLSEVLAMGESDFALSEVTRPTKYQNLRVVTAGEPPINPSELLDSLVMSNLMTEIKSKSDFVIIDTPPALAVTDGLVLLPHVDGVILVFRSGYNDAEQANLLVKNLKNLNANIIGIVANDISIRYKHESYQQEKKTISGVKKTKSR